MASEPTKIEKLYNGKIEIGFWENQHRYSLIKNGVPERTWLLSVTSATGMIDKSRVLMKWATGLAKDFLFQQEKITPALIEEACNLYNVRREEAATTGSLVHAYIEARIKGEKPDLPNDDKAVVSINAFLDWEKKHKVKWLISEKIVYSKKYDYVGLLDAIAIIDRKTSVIDFKTANGVYNEYLYQIAAYRAAHEEEQSKKLSGDSIIVRFDKETAKFEVHNCQDHDKDFKAFLGALAIKQREKELEKEWRDNQK